VSQKNNIQSYVSTLKKKIKSLLTRIYKKIFTFSSHLPGDEKLIIFESFLGKQYSCNPRAIYEYLRDTQSDYKMYWSVDKNYTAYFQEEGIPYLRRFSVKWLIKMARAGYWVSNSRLPLWIPKPKHTTYLQTWHGTPLKKLAADMKEVHMPGTTTEKYKKNFHSETSKWDYLISPNTYSTEIFSRAFNVPKEKIIESGYPRNDILYTSHSHENIQRLKESLELPHDKKIILYAPTWRDDEFYSVGKYKFNLQLDLHMLQAALGEDYVILLRLHYLIAENLDLKDFERFAYNFSDFVDISQLYLVSDILITDYSSVFFDYANLKRPMIFFAYDIDTYRDKLRGFYFDFENLAPGPLVKTTEAVIEEVKKFEQTNGLMDSSFMSFYEKFCGLEDGHASSQVVEKVFRKK